MANVLILNLGSPDVPQFPPASMAKVEINGESPDNVRAIYVEIDASEGRPAHFHMDRTRFSDGQVWNAEEAHIISSMSLVIEYQEGA